LHTFRAQFFDELPNRLKNHSKNCKNLGDNFSRNKSRRKNEIKENLLLIKENNYYKKGCIWIQSKTAEPRELFFIVFINKGEEAF